MCRSAVVLISRVNYQRNDNFKCTVGSHLPQTITALALLPQCIAGTSLPSLKGRITWLARVHVHVHRQTRCR